MSDKLICSVCGNTTSSFFMVLGINSICSDCKNKHKSKRIEKLQKPPIFIRYICKTHDCGTYGVTNMMFRHAMKSCDIVTQQTLGIIRPATYGGHNGDIGRRYFLGINEMNRLEINLANYKKFARIHSRLNRGKVSYSDRKYYNKHVKFLNLRVEKNYHKLDEAFLKLKFNLDVYIQSIIPRFMQSRISTEERNSLYYKDLMTNFKLQVVNR